MLPLRGGQRTLGVLRKSTKLTIFNPERKRNRRKGRKWCYFFGLETLVVGLVFVDELGCEVGGDDGVFFDVFENALKVV